MRKYLRIFQYSARDQLIYLPSFLTRNIFFVVLMFIFYSLWRVIYSDRPTIEGLTIVQTLWYLTFTETVELSRTRVMQQIQEDVKDGTVAYNLCRPYSYVLFHVYRSMGESIIKILPILVEGFILAYIFVGPLPGYFTALPFGLILIIGGLLLNTLWLLNIGLLAFWVEEVSPFSWIMSRLVFILGGLLFPINFFPDWLRSLSASLPFAFQAYWPAYTMVNFSIPTFLFGLRGMLIYATVLFMISVLLFNTARRRVHVQGG
jgi:ABC-2 type transport system permease protein